MIAYLVHIYIALGGEEAFCYFGYPPVAEDVIRYLAAHPDVGGVSDRCAELITLHGLSCVALNTICPCFTSSFAEGFVEINRIYVDRNEHEDRRMSRIHELLSQRRLLVDEFKNLLKRGDTLGHEIANELDSYGDIVKELPCEVLSR